MFNKKNNILYILITVLFVLPFSGCSSVYILSEENIKPNLQTKNIDNIIIPSTISGYLLEDKSTRLFDNPGGTYNYQTQSIFGKLEDGQQVNVSLDTLRAVYLKLIDNVNMIALESKQFTIEIQKKPSKIFNPCWDFVRIKKNSIYFNNSKKSLIGVTKRGNEFEVLITDVQSIYIKQKNVYKTIRVVLTAIGLYAFTLEGSEIFQ